MMVSRLHRVERGFCRRGVGGELGRTGDHHRLQGFAVGRIIGRDLLRKAGAAKNIAARASAMLADEFLRRLGT